MKRFNVVENGYDIEEVNKFIDIVISKLEKLSEDNNRYLIQLEELKKEAANNKTSATNNEMDARVTKALLVAQETTDKMRELAKEEANLIIREAKDNANAIVHEALVQAQKTEQEYELLEKNYKVYKSKVESLIRAQLELLNDKHSEE